MRSGLLSVFILGLCLAAAPPGVVGQPVEEEVQEGIHALKAGDYSLARRIFERVVERAPSALNFTYLAMSEAGDGKLGPAITHFRQSIRLGNNSAEVHYNLGLVDLRAHNVSQGVRELQHALSIDPNLKSALYTLALTLLDARRPEEAVPFLFRAREQSPCDAEIWANLVRAQLEAGDTNAALRTIHEAVDGMPTNVRLFVTLASLCSSHHQAQQARHLLENASELTPEDFDIKLLLAKVSLQAKEPIEALSVVKEVPSSRGAPGEVPFIKGLALALAGQPEAAAPEFSSAIAADPRNTRFLIAQAWSYQLEGHHDEALSVLKKAGELDPRAPIVPYRMAVSYFCRQQYAQAVSCCEEALRSAPRYDPAYLLLGVAQLERGDLRAARAAIQQAVALKPDAALYHRELGVALFKAGDLSESQRELDRALSLDPKAAPAYFWHARVVAGQGDTQQAITDLETAVALQPDDPHAYSELVQLYSKNGQPEKAAAMVAKQKELKETGASDDRQGFLSDLSDPQL